MSIAPIRTLKNRNGGFEPFEQDFAYTGNVQTLSVPSRGLYKLEVWGASGGYGYGYYGGPDGTGGGKGGYCVGYCILQRNATIKIYCGGAGGNGVRNDYGGAGGYNGGGNGGRENTGQGHEIYNTGGGGGGKTHIASADNVTIIAAGGGSGGMGSTYGDGRSGANANSGASVNGSGGNGGANNGWATGGTYSINGVPEITYKGETYTPSTSNGVQSGNGKAKITRIA